MYRFSACIAMGAMLFALVSGPLFHIHDRDDHGNAGPVLHAHFPGLEKPLRQSGNENEVETQHSHMHVRWIDVFTLSAPVAVHFQVVAEISESPSVPPPAVTGVVVSFQTLRAHSPPDYADLPSRSPPAR